MTWSRKEMDVTGYFLFRANVIVLMFSLIIGSCVPAGAQGFSVSGLPEPGSMVSVSQPYSPALLRGMVISPNEPLKLDFIVTSGQDHLAGDDLARESRRMINYFLAALTTPQKDLWVNLSPTEKDRIIPDSLIKTEMGNDLLGQDYLLKQLAASLIYPEEGIGRKFWDKVYAQAYAKLGLRDIPVDVFNKVWIVPERASVFEKDNAVYVTKIHLKVMLEADYLTQNAMAGQTSQGPASPEGELSKQLLREVIVPVIEQEVNEGKHFARLRQIVHAMVLAQWYQDVLKEGVLNKVYAGQNKVAGIDLSDPGNKELIYEQYMAAYKKGVFDYIKEEKDPATSGVMPRKYFSGGFEEKPIPRESVGLAGLTDPRAGNSSRVSVVLDEAQESLVEPKAQWDALVRPLSILMELISSWKGGNIDRQGGSRLVEGYARQVDGMDLYAVQSTWPVLKAVSLMEKKQEQQLVQFLQEKYAGQNRPKLVDALLLMNNIYSKNWLKEEVPMLVGRTVYLVAMEIHHWAGGLGPVMKFHGKGMQDLGADVAYFEPWYQLTRDKGNPDGDPLDYTDKNGGLKDINEDFDEFSVKLGTTDGNGVQQVKVKVASATDENGVRVYLIRDVQDDGTSYYTRMLYNYGGRNNPVGKEESMTFFNVAGSELLARLEAKRMKQQGGSWKPAIVHTNDGQVAPFQAVALSRHGDETAVKDVFWAFTTHTIFNRGETGDAWGIPVFLKHMMGIKDRFINAFRTARGGAIDHTSGGIRLANWAGAVSNKHRDDMQPRDPMAKLVAVTNGAVPEEMAAVFREEFKRLQDKGLIAGDADYERPTAQEVRLTKLACKQRLNDMKISTANGDVLEVDLTKPLVGYSRRLVPEKAGRNRAFTDENIWQQVRLGYNVVLFGSHQGTQQSEDIARPLRELEKRIAAAKKEDPEAFPGQFRFVQAFTPLQKKAFLAAEDIQVQDSDNHTGAAEYSEEDITANAGLQAGGRFEGLGEGVIVAQGIPLDFDNPGSGQTLIPQEDTQESWLKTVFEPTMRLWHEGQDHINFYTNAALSPRLNRIQRYLMTSAAYLREYNKVLEQEERYVMEDKEAAKSLVEALKGREVKEVLVSGRNGVTSSFEFDVWGVGKFLADPSNEVKGLRSFTSKRKELEDKYGYDALLQYYLGFDYQKYLSELFKGLAAGDVLKAWMRRLEESPEPDARKSERLEKLIESVANLLEARLASEGTGTTGLLAGREDRSQANGGIDARHIGVDRSGDLMAGIVGDKALEQMLREAPGLTGIIVGIQPIKDLPQFLGAGSK